MLAPMAESTSAAAREPVRDLWEGFASAHTWIYIKHSWWHLIPQPIDASAPADSAAPHGLDSPCHVLTAYNPDGAWLEPAIAIVGLSRHQAQLLGQAYGQLAVYELDGAIRRVVACDSDRVLVQAVACHRERQPPTPTRSPRSQPAPR
jgi:hypothetical protein